MMTLFDSEAVKTLFIVERRAVTALHITLLLQLRGLNFEKSLAVLGEPRFAELRAPGRNPASNILALGAKLGSPRLSKSIQDKIDSLALR